jgi:hypothetical protein
MLHDLAIIIEPENIDPGPIAITRPLLMAMQDDVVPFGDHTLEMYALTRILLRHPRKILDESSLTVGHRWVVLNVNVARVPLDSFGGL